MRDPRSLNQVDTLRSRYDLNSRARWRLNLLRPERRDERSIVWTDRGLHRFTKWIPLLMPLIAWDVGWFGTICFLLLDEYGVGEEFWQSTGTVVALNLVILLPLWMRTRRGRRLVHDGERYRFSQLFWWGQRQVDEGSIDELEVRVRPFTMTELTRSRLFYGLIVQHSRWQFLLATREVDGTMGVEEFRDLMMQQLPRSLAKQGITIADRMLAVRSSMAG